MCMSHSSDDSPFSVGGALQSESFSRSGASAAEHCSRVKSWDRAPSKHTATHFFTFVLTFFSQTRTDIFGFVCFFFNSLKIPLCLLHSTLANWLSLSHLSGKTQWVWFLGHRHNPTGILGLAATLMRGLWLMWVQHCCWDQTSVFYFWTYFIRMPSFKEMNSASFELCLCVTVAFPFYRLLPNKLAWTSRMS